MAPSADDWLAVCRRATAGLRDMLAATSTTAERAVEVGPRGAGGDRSLVIDTGAEDVIFAELDALHADGARFVAVSEERGEVDYGDPAVRVVIDPIDGSLNAKRTLPAYSFSFAVAVGDDDGRRRGGLRLRLRHRRGVGGGARSRARR